MAEPLRPAIASIIRRLARSPRRDDFIVRGGAVTRQYVAPHPRPVEDLDLQWLRDQFDPDAVNEQLGEILAVDDPVEIAPGRCEVIWGDTDFPGLRCALEVGGEPLQLDVGFGDPLVDGPLELELAGASVLACRPETLLGWKVHGLFERGPGRWRPKDLHDVDLLIRFAAVGRERVSASIRTAFASRGDELSIAERLGRGEFGISDWSARKWRRFCESRPAGVDPGELAEVVARVSAYLRSDLVAGAGV
jgi:hypothetical protein